MMIRGQIPCNSGYREAQFDILELEDILKTD